MEFLCLQPKLHLPTKLLDIRSWPSQTLECLLLGSVLGTPAFLFIFHRSLAPCSRVNIPLLEQSPAPQPPHTFPWANRTRVMCLLLQTTCKFYQLNISHMKLDYCFSHTSSHSHNPPTEKAGVQSASGMAGNRHTLPFPIITLFSYDYLSLSLSFIFLRPWFLMWV